MSHLTDEALIRRVRNGDISSYEQLVRRYQRLVFGVAFHTLEDVEDARDVAQDVFIRAFVRLDQVRDPLKLGSWLRQIAVNECRAWIAKNRERAEMPPSEGRNAFTSAEDRLLLSEALNAIDETSRLTVILFYLHSYSLKEIGAFLDEPVSTIKSRLRNSRAKLRREMEKMLEKNFDQESLPEGFADRVTQIIEASRAGDGGKIRALLEKDPKLVESEEIPGRHTPLHIAAASGDAAVVELLLSYGADPNALDESDNASPLHYAAERGWLDCVMILVEAGADVNWNRDVHERGPLGWAVFFDPLQRDVAEYLMAKGAKLDVFSAIALDRSSAIRELAANDPSIVNRKTSVCDGSLSAVEYATSTRRIEAAKLLVELGATVGIAEAAGLGWTEQVEKKLAERPEREKIDRAVEIAVKSGQKETTRQLLIHGANPDYAPQGTSLVFSAIASNDRELSALLLEFGADLEYRDRAWKSTALGWEVFFGRSETARLALELGAKVDPQLIDLAQAGERGELRRHSSASAEHYRKVVELLERWDVSDA